MAYWDNLVPEVTAFLKVNGEPYIQFVGDIVSDLNRIKHYPQCSGLIYSVYSRSDKQGGDQLKAEWKIAKKLCDWRTKKPSTAINEIHDIIGVTVVVNFPSDRDVVADYLSTPGALPCAIVCGRDTKEEQGYHAIHLRIKGSTMGRSLLMGEIQIKTMLHDGWGAKTHDLTYKSDGIIEETLLKHMGILGDVLRQLDDQSELIKDAIKKEWRDDRKFRAVARDSLFSSLINSPAADAGLIEIAKEVEKTRGALEMASPDDPLMQAIHKHVSDLQTRIGWGRDICQLITFVASLRLSHDLDAYALSAIDNWLAACKTAKEKILAWKFRTLTFYALGMYEEAVKSAREAVDLAAKEGTNVEKESTLGNLAYFISEFVVSMGRREPALVTEAKELSKRAVEMCDPPHPASLDTRGAVLIAMGENQGEVREGLRMCQDAFAKASGAEKSVAEAYFKLHERRAFRKLLEWD